MIQCSNLTKTFAGRLLLDDVSFQINSGEKVGLVGRNGFGKTTLLKILIGEEEHDSGTISMPKNYKIGYLKQNIEFTEKSVIEECIKGLAEDEKQEVWKAEKILFGLGFSSEDITKNPMQISGGFMVRLNLAKTLLSSSNMLILDEPTNFLDITSIRYLEKFLKEWKGELILVTHDRSFMDQIVTHTMAIHRKKIKKIAGDTSKLYIQIAQEEEIYEKQRINDDKKREQAEIYISKFRAKARLAGLIQSRIKMLAKQEKKERLEQIKNLDFRFKYEDFEPPRLMEVSNLTFGYKEDNPLIKDLSFYIGKKDRIAIIGPNGKGKSTLLKLLQGELTPQCGKIKKHSQFKAGYFGQTNKPQLHQDNTVLDEILSFNPENTELEARKICGAMLFEEDDVFKKIKILSGGEKSRVLLAKILSKPVNILLLDEPTNHLDMESCDALLASLDDFDGAVVIVTHNEMFLHAIAERLIVFDGGKTFVYENKYSDFLEKVGWVSEKQNKIIEEDPETVRNKKDIRKIRAAIIEEKSKVLKPIEKRYNMIEQEIIKMEDNYKNLEEELIEASSGKNADKIADLSKEIHRLENKIKEFYKEYDEVVKEYERESKRFEEMLFNEQLS
jgi:ATP-binding cassette subfamily F protein 3